MSMRETLPSHRRSESTDSAAMSSRATPPLTMRMESTALASMSARRTSPSQMCSLRITSSLMSVVASSSATRRARIVKGTEASSRRGVISGSASTL